MVVICYNLLDVFEGYGFSQLKNEAELTSGVGVEPSITPENMSNDNQGRVVGSSYQIICRDEK